MKGKVSDAEFYPGENRIEYTVTFENGETAEMEFHGSGRLDKAISEEAMEGLAGELPGTEVKEDVYEALEDASDSLSELTIGVDPHPSDPNA